MENKKLTVHVSDRLMYVFVIYVTDLTFHLCVCRYQIMCFLPTTYTKQQDIVKHTVLHTRQYIHMLYIVEIFQLQSYKLYVKLSKQCLCVIHLSPDL